MKKLKLLLTLSRQSTVRDRRVISLWLISIFLISTVSFAQTWSQGQRAYGGSSSDYGESISQTSDGGYIVGGYTNSWGAGLTDVYLIKLD